MAIRIISVIAILFLTACPQESAQAAQVTASESETATKVTIDDIARHYLVLELAMGEVSPGHVDAYFGPEELSAEAKNSDMGLEQIASGADKLAAQLQAWDTSGDDLLRSRVDGLLARMTALTTRIAMQQGEDISFDDEVQRLFATSLRPDDPEHYEQIIAEIDALVPGDGSLNERLNQFLDGFNIPADKLAEVMDASIAECKRRSAQFIDLPPEENFTVEYVTDKPWGGYNWYQGNSTSLIQINTDLPSRINSAVALGCHEGYPGHHVYNTLLEQNMVNKQGWVEFSLYPLFSPQSLIAEGSANYGVELAFPGKERIEFEKNVLFPIAGLDPALAEDFYALQELQGQLSFSRNEAARAYLNGNADAEQTIQQLMKYGFTTRERAEQSLRFIENYRSYVINYNHGKDLVADFIDSGTSSPAERWAKFQTLLSNPVLPEDLVN